MQNIAALIETKKLFLAESHEEYNENSLMFLEKASILLM